MEDDTIMAWSLCHKSATASKGPSRPPCITPMQLRPPLTRHIQLHSERLGAGGGWHGAGAGGCGAGRGTRAAGGGRGGLGADVLLVGEVVVLGDLPRFGEEQSYLVTA